MNIRKHFSGRYWGLFAGLIMGISFPAQAAKDSAEISLSLSFNKGPVCMVNGIAVADSGFKKYDEDSISWKAGCKVAIPKSMTHCILTGQSVSNSDAISSWSSVVKDGYVMAKLVSESDINTNFGKFTAHYFCH